MKNVLILMLFLSTACATSQRSEKDTFSEKELMALYEKAIGATPIACQTHKDCKNGALCSKVETNTLRCVQKADVAPQTFNLPFAPGTSVVCTQNAAYLDGSHSGPSTFYALDLTTPFDKPASTIAAAAAGTAYVFDGCPNLPGTPKLMKADRCGNGWGNNVRIDHGDGIISLYAHLSKIFVKTGDAVQAQQAIGIEGGTGWAGYRHLHFDVQRLPGEKDLWKKILDIPSLNGISIPHSFRVKINGKATVKNSSKVVCKKEDMSQVLWTAP